MQRDADGKARAAGQQTVNDPNNQTLKNTSWSHDIDANVTSIELVSASAGDMGIGSSLTVYKWVKE